MMTCSRARELLPLLLYDDLDPADASAARGHLQQCDSCRQEFTALGGVRQALETLPAPAANVDLGQIYAEAAARQQRQARRWRRAALALSAVAAVLLIAFGLKLEMRFEQHQFTLRWGAVATPPVLELPAPKPEVSQPAAVSATDIQLLKGLIQVMMTDLQDRDRQQQQALVRLHLQLEVLQRQSQQRWVTTERDLMALYTAQFGARDKGD